MAATMQTRPLMDDLRNALAEREGGRDAPAPRTKQRMMLDKLIEQAVDKNDVRSAQLLINLKREADEALAKESEAPDAEDLPAEDDAVLADFLRQQQADGSAR